MNGFCIPLGPKRLLLGGGFGIPEPAGHSVRNDAGG